MICHFLLLKAPIRSSKLFENSPASSTDRRRCLTAEAEFPGKCYSEGGVVIPPGSPQYSFKSVPRSLVHPGEENRPGLTLSFC